MAEGEGSLLAPDQIGDDGPQSVCIKEIGIGIIEEEEWGEGLEVALKKIEGDPDRVEIEDTEMVIVLSEGVLAMIGDKIENCSQTIENLIHLVGETFEIGICKDAGLPFMED